ncbi:hypothetical protein PMAYCL1PPCAC_27880, partial [Pristionchus mayeri]
LWRRFEISIASVQRRTGMIDGFVGQHLNQTSKLMFELGNSFHTNFADSWEKRIGGKSIDMQQACAIEAFQELKRSLVLIMEIQLSKSNHVQHSSVKGMSNGSKAVIDVDKPFDVQNPSNFNEGLSGIMKDLVASSLLFDNGAPIKEDPMVIKEDLLDELADSKQKEPIATMNCTTTEIKDEPINEFAYIMQEPQINEMLCPSTGIFRSLVKFAPMENDVMRKKFLCFECGMKFNKVFNLNRHMRIHSGEKSFSCPYCNSSFRAIFNRHRHIRLVHKIQGSDVNELSPGNEVGSFHNASGLSNMEHDTEEVWRGFIRRSTICENDIYTKQLKQCINVFSNVSGCCIFLVRFYPLQIQASTGIHVSFGSMYLL